MDKQDIKNFTLVELKKEMSKIQEPLFRANQIFGWLYKKGIFDFGDMTNMPKSLKDKLAQGYFIGTLKLSKHLKSKDATEKFLFQLADGSFIETVLIHAGPPGGSACKRKTICLSTQVGCKFACAFCASGRGGFKRDLEPCEIISQILFLAHEFEHDITNYVFMGMGEPLDNYENLIRAITIMNDPQGMAIGARRITVSTCGIIPAIKKLAKINLQINLSISLHAANDALRNTLVPANKKYPLKELINACMDYLAQGGRMLTLEYLLIKNKNDSEKDLNDLSIIASELNAKVNLIMYNKVPGFDFEPLSENDADIFLRQLIERGAKATLRQSKGEDIQAACGQLAPSALLW